jgi:DNA-binding NtrC family response regulator
MATGHENGAGLPTTAEIPPEPSGPLRGVVQVTTGSAAGRVVRIDPGHPVTFGRAPECTVVLSDAGISRVHAEIECRGGQYLLRDKGSRNGTFLGDDRVEVATPLAHGDGIRVGATVRLRFTLVDEAEERDLARVGDALPREAARLQSAATDPEANAGGSVVRDGVMRALYEQAGRAAKANISVLILGETGAGKEVLAQAIHRASPRADKPFLALNCAALTETLLEAELFGHERNAFTGASHAREGLFEAASGGTIFLDEVGELPAATQVKLLRVIEDRKVLRIGARTPRAIDVRFISATNRDLEAESERGGFRADLFFRLNGIALTVPPLRDRRGEIEELANLFLSRGCVESGRGDVPALSPAARDALLAHNWPGNVRELRNAIDRALVLCTGPAILLEHLPPRVAAGPGASAKVATTPPAPGDGSLRDHVDAAERQRVAEVLERCGGNQTLAAVELGISRRTLVARLSEWGLTRPRRPR